MLLRDGNSACSMATGKLASLVRFFVKPGLGVFVEVKATLVGEDRIGTKARKGVCR